MNTGAPIGLGQSDQTEQTEYRVGCSSWLDPSLLAEGTFYPAPEMSAEERLQWYARFFNCVEVNSTYYSPPSQRNAQLWAERTPPGFEFAIKAYSLMTGHNPKAQGLPKDIKAMLPPSATPNPRGEIERKHFPKEALDLCFQWFREALAPLDYAGKLSYLLFQFAPWIGHSSQALDYLASLPHQFPGWKIAVEFRNPSWIPKRTDEVLKFLQDHGLLYVAVDCPWQPLIPVATGDWAVFRFHGRNVAGWEAQLKGKQPTVAEKYEYLYSPHELSDLADKVKRLHGKARRVYTKFNNNARDYMVQGAIGFCSCLGLPVADLEAARAAYQASHPAPPRSRRARPRFFFPPEEKPRQIRIDEPTEKPPNS